jgi:hypothetical protein
MFSLGSIVAFSRVERCVQLWFQLLKADRVRMNQVRSMVKLSNDNQTDDGWSLGMKAALGLLGGLVIAVLVSGVAFVSIWFWL